jgi:uncharacterized RDD family membrane protein YckC
MIHKIFALCLIALLAFRVAPAAAGPRDLVSAASDDAVVLAYVQPPDKSDTDATTVHSTILMRRLSKETRWHKLATISGRVISIAAQADNARVLLDNGDWMTIWEDGDSLGPPILGVKLIAFTADHDDLWAVGIPAPVPEAATRATTASSQPTPLTSAAAAVLATLSAPATQPTTAPLITQPTGPALYHFDGVHWSSAAALPANIGSLAPSSISLAFLDHNPVLAINQGPAGIHVWSLENGKWVDVMQAQPSRIAKDFGLLDAGLPPTVWFTPGGPGELATVAGNRPLGPDGSGENDSRSATRAAEAIRLFSASGEHLFEQDYSPDGTAMDKPVELTVDAEGPATELENWIAPLLTVILTMLLFGATRRTELEELPTALTEANLALAPLLPRFIAGVIDALPVLISMLIVAGQLSQNGSGAQMPTNGQMLPFYIGTGIYLLYVSLSELVFATTLGKWIFGLKIVTAEGTRPPAVAILVRNILRLVDITLVWLPLAVVLFSPLRQRLGDITAATLVVRHAEASQTP